MKKYIFLLFLFHFSFIQAQDTLVSRSGRRIVGKVDSIGKKKITYTIPPDTVKKSIPTWRIQYIRYSGGTQLNLNPPLAKNSYKPSTTELYLTADGGFNVPFGSYHDAIAGTHFHLGATFYFYNHVGIRAIAGEDLNATGLNYFSNNYWGGFYVFRQYFAGLCYRTGGKPNYPWVDFVALFGVCTASNPSFEEGGGINGITINTPGNGSGPGGYIGMDFTSSANHLCSLTFGLGCLGAAITYPNYTSSYSLYNPYENSTNNTVSKSSAKMSLGLVQMHFAINFRLKKADR